MYYTDDPRSDRTLEDLAYQGAHDHASLQADLTFDKAAACYDRGDLIGEALYLSLYRAWLDCRHSLVRTPFNWGGGFPVPRP